MLFVDFDHTLYNSEAFLRGLWQAIPEPPSWRSFRATFESLTERTSDAPYDPHAHIRQLVREPHNASIAINLVDQFIAERSGSYLYRDARAFLKRIRLNGFQVELLTYSGRDLRLAQLRSASIIDAFDDVHAFGASRKEKVDYAIKRAEAGGLHLLLDDHPQVLAETIGTSLRGLRIQRRIVKKYVGREPGLPGIQTVRTLAQASTALLALA